MEALRPGAHAHLDQWMVDAPRGGDGAGSPRSDIPRRILEGIRVSWLLSAGCLQRLWIDTCLECPKPAFVAAARRRPACGLICCDMKMTISTPGVPERSAAFRGVPRRTRAL